MNVLFNSKISKFYIRSSFVRSSFVRSSFVRYYNHDIRKLNKYVNNNLEHIDNIEIKINNPKKINIKSIFNIYLYSVKICIIKDNIFLIKTIEDNDLDKILKQADNFINNKIDI